MLQVLAGLSDKEQQAFMRFVTSCSRAPLGGFQFLIPPLTLHKVCDSHQSVSTSNGPSLNLWVQAQYAVAITSKLLHAKLRRAVPYLLEPSIMSCHVKWASALTVKLCSILKSGQPVFKIFLHVLRAMCAQTMLWEETAVWLIGCLCNAVQRLSLQKLLEYQHTVHGCSEQPALERQDLPGTRLPHHEPESKNIIIVRITILIIIIVIILIIIIIVIINILVTIIVKYSKLGFWHVQVPCEASLLALVGGKDVDPLPFASRNIMIIINMFPAQALVICRCLVKHLC